MPCNHAHGHNKKADHFTNAGTAGETFESTWGNFLWGFGRASVANGPTAILKNCIVGGVMTLFAPGAIYAHRKLAKDHADSQSTAASTHSETLTSPLNHSHPEHVKLSKCQWLFLLCDFCTHTIDRSSGFVSALAFLDLLGALPLVSWQVGLIQDTVTLLSAYTIWADVRNCKDAIEKQNAKELAENEDHVDRPTILI